MNVQNSLSRGALLLACCMASSLSAMKEEVDKRGGYDSQECSKHATPQFKATWDLLNKYTILDKIKTSQAVADFGCGSGKLMQYLAMRYPRTRFYGFDKSVTMITEAQKNTQKNTSYTLHDIVYSPFDVAIKYDVAICFAVLHWIAQKDQYVAIKNMVDTLNQGGVFILQAYSKRDTQTPIEKAVYSAAKKCEVSLQVDNNTFCPL